MRGGLMRRTTKIIFNYNRKNNTLTIHDLYDRFMKRNKNKTQLHYNTKKLLLPDKVCDKRFFLLFHINIDV